MDLLEGQEESIDDLLQRSKGGGGGGSGSNTTSASGELASLMAQIMKMDLDRTRYMLVDLARVRMAKIENYALHNKTLVGRMTEEEVSIFAFVVLFVCMCCCWVWSFAIVYIRRKRNGIEDCLMVASTFSHKLLLDIITN